MKKIILKSLALVNFKGVRDFSIAFNDGITTVCGDNGTGKTTLYDAYLWLLFGKDSTGRSDGANGFNVKTTGEDGKPIYRLEHSVTAVLEVDGKEIKLQRSLVEKWQKVNGTTDEVMKDETQYLINDVRTGTKKEYQAEISEIIPEDVFRMITNPYYFTSLSAETQKDMLLEMVGNIDDEEVAATDPDFLALLDQINGTSLAKWTREIAAKKKSCNDALATIPASIETAQKLMPASENWAVLEKQLKEVQDRVKGIDAQIADKSALNDEAYKRKMALMKQQADKRIKLQDRENTICMEANAAHNKALSDIQQMENELSIKLANILCSTSYVPRKNNIHIFKFSQQSTHCLPFRLIKSIYSECANTLSWLTIIQVAICYLNIYVVTTLVLGTFSKSDCISMTSIAQGGLPHTIFCCNHSRMLIAVI